MLVFFFHACQHSYNSLELGPIKVRCREIEHPETWLNYKRKGCTLITEQHGKIQTRKVACFKHEQYSIAPHPITGRQKLWPPYYFNIPETCYTNDDSCSIFWTSLSPKRNDTSKNQLDEFVFTRLSWRHPSLLEIHRFLRLFSKGLRNQSTWK